MKKLIYSLSFAIACGFAANAANTNMSMQKVSKLSVDDFQTLQKASTSMEFVRISPDNRKVKRAAATSAKDFEGTYKWSGDNRLGSTVFPNEGIMTIEVETDGTIAVYGFDYYADYLEANFDAATGRLNIPNAPTVFNDYYNYEVWFYNYFWVNTVWTEQDAAENPGSKWEIGQKLYRVTPASEDTPFFFTLSENGIQAGNGYPDQEKFDAHEYTDEELQNFPLAANIMPDYGTDAFFWLCAFIEGEPLQAFNYVADQWQELGMSEFKDAWFQLLWGETDYDPIPYEVPVYYDKTNPGRYLLYEPYSYGDENPYSLIYEGDKPGYIVFNITDPECVVVEPLVYAISMLYGEDIEDFYCMNYEGYNYYLLGADKEEMIIYFDQQDLDMSYLDERNNTVYIYNAGFTMGLNADFYQWNNVTNSGSIKLPSNYMDSVETILGEDANAPAIYYNLQGQRVNNPEKGQLLIVKKGNKTSKQIIR